MVRNGRVFNQKLSTRIIIVLLLFKNFTTILLYRRNEKRSLYLHNNPLTDFFFLDKTVRLSYSEARVTQW